MEFLKLLLTFLFRNPFLFIPALIGIGYAVYMSVADVDCETRQRMAVNRVSCD